MDQQTITAYNDHAKQYDLDTSDFWDRFPDDTISTFAQSVGTGHILDVGSGPGRDALLLQGKGVSLTCLDASQSMVDMCIARGLKAEVGDFMKLPFSNEKFDGVWAYTSLLHIPKSDITLALREISRVLKSGGTFGLGMIEGEDEKYRDSLQKSPRWFSYYKKEELEEQLKNAGFVITYFDTFVPNTRTYLNFVCSKSN